MKTRGADRTELTALTGRSRVVMFGNSFWG